MLVYQNSNIYQKFSILLFKKSALIKKYLRIYINYLAFLKTN